MSVGMYLWLTNSIDDYPEKYCMMGGLVQKTVTALVTPSSWASDWPELLQQLSFWLARGAPGGSWASDLPELLQQLSFWLARAAPGAAAVAVAKSFLAAEIDGKVHHAPLVLAIFWEIIYSSS